MADFLWPSEAAMHGEGLKYSALWMLLAAVRLAQQSTRPRACRIRPANWIATALMSGLLMMIVAHWVSTWYVFRIEGDRRAALNLSFEWTAAAAIFYLIASVSSQLIQRQRILATLIGIGLGLSIVGIWQHHFFYKSQAEWYRQQTSSSSTGTSSGQAALDESRTRTQLQQMQLPTSGSGRQLFEQRLLASSEPFGTFALANTLGGYLAIVTVLIVAAGREFINRKQRPPVMSCLFVLGTLLLVGYCLILTKSRTAWIGTAAAIACLMVLNSQRIALRQWAIRLGLTGAFVTLLAGASLAIGLIDREVILESPRSLQFRLLYWTGTADVIAEEPLFGTGPGNFRQVYLKYKRPESSEEILDPHNIVLDAWATTGLAGLCGVLLILGACGVGLFSAATNSDDSPVYPNENKDYYSGNFYVLAVCAGWCLHQFVRWWDGDLWNELQTAYLAIPAACVVTHWSMPTLWRCSPRILIAGLGALLVHLMGAGGLQITIVPVLLAVVSAVVFAQLRRKYTPTQQSTRSIIRLTAAVVALAISGAIIQYGIRPVDKSRRWLEEASYLESLGKTQAATSACDSAAAADLLAPKPRQQKMSLLAYKLIQQLRTRSFHPDNDSKQTDSIHELANQVLKACQELAERDRRLVLPHYYQSKVLTHLSGMEGFEDAERNTIAEIETVLELYPSNGMFRAEAANMFFSAGKFESAKNAANRALQIDNINHKWGHQDRYLPDDVLQSLKDIVSMKSVH